MRTTTASKQPKIEAYLAGPSTAFLAGRVQPSPDKWFEHLKKAGEELQAWIGSHRDECDADRALVDLLVAGAWLIRARRALAQNNAADAVHAALCAYSHGMEAETRVRVSPLYRAHAAMANQQGKGRPVSPKTTFILEFSRRFSDLSDERVAHKIFDEAPDHDDGVSFFYWRDFHETVGSKIVPARMFVDRDKPDTKLTVRQLAGRISKARNRSGAKKGRNAFVPIDRR